jgi:ubiquitin-activating enzyme E1
MKQANSFEACVLLAKNCFNNYYHHTILDLLSIFPKDHVDKEGQPFWSGPKRAPSHIEFDPSNKMHAEFIVAYANLIATAMSIPENRDVAAVTAIAKNAQADPYVPKKIKVQTPEEEKNNNNNQPEPAATPEDETLIEELLKELETLKTTVQKEQFQPADFEKDDDSNFHIAFINASANLRATNYQIANCDFAKTKMIAGKIIPAIATTTAMITGAVTAEIYKFV